MAIAAMKVISTRMTVIKFTSALRRLIFGLDSLWS
jgi:hypothetical protein